MLHTLQIFFILKICFVHSLYRHPLLDSSFQKWSKAPVNIEEDICNRFVDLYDASNATIADISSWLKEELRTLDDQMKSIQPSSRCDVYASSQRELKSRCILATLNKIQAEIFEKEQEKFECDDPSKSGCETPVNIDHGKWICSEDKDVCSVVCDPGYKLSSPNPQVQCKTDGQTNSWIPSPQSLSCSCGSKPKNPPKGDWLCWSGADGSTECELECSEGYMPNVSGAVICSGESWSQDLGSISCSPCGGSTGRECPQKPPQPDEVIFITGGAGYFESEVVDLSGNCGGEKEPFGPPQSRTNWRTGTTAGRNEHVSFLLKDGRTLVVCGGKGFGSRFPEIPFTCISSTHPATGGWSQHKSRFSNGRISLSGAAVGDSIVVVGGDADYKYSFKYDMHDNTLEILTGDEWVSGTRLESSVGSGSCTVATGEETLIVTGGKGNQTKVAEYNIRTNAWRILPSMEDRREEHTCGVVEVRGRRFMVVAGGKDLYLGKREGRERSTAVFDLETEEWKDGGNLNHVRSMAAMVRVGGKLVVVGGWQAPNTLEVMKQDFTWKEVNVGMHTTHNWMFSAASVPRSLVC